MPSTASVARPVVLVVDDEPEILKTVIRLLSRRGCDAIGATCATDALEIALREHPAVVISDYRMPSTNGAAFLRQVLASLPTTACVLMSGGADFRDETLPADVIYLAKPWSAIELLAAVESALSRASPNVAA